VRVVEIGHGPAAAFAGMLLAELGADVVRVEAPAGCRPYAGAEDAIQDPDLLAYVNRRKLSVTLDLHSRRGSALLAGIALTADALIEDLGPAGLRDLRLSYRRLKRASPDIIVASISPFGASGPRSSWQASELVVEAMGGIVYSTGWDAEPPLKLAGYPAHFIAGIHAATAVQAAVFGIAAGNERGAHIDLSMEEAFLHHWARHIAQWAYNGTGSRREPRAIGRQGFPHTVMAGDGWLYLLALSAEWEALALFLGLEPFVTHEWSDPGVRAARWPEIEPHFFQSIQSKSRYDWFEKAAHHHYTFAPIDNALELLASPQYAARGFLRPAEIDGEDIMCPGLPFTFRSEAPRPNHSPGPASTP